MIHITMRKIGLVSLIALSTIALTACGSKKTWMDSSDVASWVESCNNYVAYLTCVADNLWDKWLATKNALAQTVENWKNYSDEELQPICEWSIEGLMKVKEMYADFDCTLEIDTPTEEAVTGSVVEDSATE